MTGQQKALVLIIITLSFVDLNLYIVQRFEASEQECRYAPKLPKCVEIAQARAAGPIGLAERQAQEQRLAREAWEHYRQQQQQLSGFQAVVKDHD